MSLHYPEDKQELNTFFKKDYLFLERECKPGRARKRGRERIGGRPPAECGARCQAPSHDPEIMT